MALERPTPEQLSSASTEELAALAAECLAQLEPGRQPLPLFKELGRLVVLSTFEITPLRSLRKSIEVLLAQRPESDPWWPRQWHLPGSVLLPTNERGINSYDNTADDILVAEFNGTVARTSEVHIFDAQRRTGVRGSEQTVFGWAGVELLDQIEAVEGGKFFKINDLLNEPPKEGLVEGHGITVQKALANYLLKQN